MKISKIRAIPLMSRAGETSWEAAIGTQETIHTLIQVVTDEDLTGIGSCYQSHSLVEGSLRMLRPIAIGESAIEPERVTELLHQRTFWYGRGGAVTHTISGIDMALWDLLGQVCGQPVSRLLGGRYHERIKAYGSILFDSVDALPEKLERVTDRGFKAIKLGWEPFGRESRALDEALVRTARKTVGDKIDLMVDAGGSDAFYRNDLKWALETAKMLAAYDITWFEEPLSPDNLDGYIELRKQSPVPISGGEVLTRRQSFIPWLEQGAVDIIQPDCSKVGGLSEARRIGWLAGDHHIKLVPHGWNTAVGLAADLCLVAALPGSTYIEYLTPTPLIDDLTLEPFTLDADGCLAISDKPGLGIELNPDGLARHAGPITE